MDKNYERGSIVNEHERQIEIEGRLTRVESASMFIKDSVGEIKIATANIAKAVEDLKVSWEAQKDSFVCQDDFKAYKKSQVSSKRYRITTILAATGVASAIALPFIFKALGWT